MRLNRLYLLFIALSANLGGALPVASEEIELRQLTDDTFRSETSRGLWLVEHFSPRCGHCKAFAPTWEQLARDHRPLERLTGFHMAQVNCLAQGDLCNTNNVKFYPQINLYSDGQFVQTYAGDRSAEHITQFIRDQQAVYSAKAAAEGETDVEESGGLSGIGRPNPEGKAVEVDHIGLESFKMQGPVLVDFYAPWCGHCKKLRPTYEEVASELRGKLNVAAVDCEAHRSFCRDNKIDGYPSIKLISGEVHTPYTGPRTKEKLLEFAAQAIQRSDVQTIKAGDLDTIVANEEAFFLYLQNFDTDPTDLALVKSILVPHLNSISAYTSSDPDFYSTLAIEAPPTSSLLAFSSHTRLPVATLSLPASYEKLSRFIDAYRFPTLTHLTQSNFADLFQSSTKATIVLATLHDGEQGLAEQKKVLEVARAWQHGERDLGQPVWFVWVGEEKWAQKWFKKSFGIKPKMLPAVVVVEPAHEEYYDATSDGAHMLLDTRSIFTVLEGSYQHFLVPKRMNAASGSGGLLTVFTHSAETVLYNPVKTLLWITGIVAAAVFGLHRYMRRRTGMVDQRVARKGSYNRLD